MMLDDKLKNVCDRFFIDKESLENYGKNSAAEEMADADRFAGTGKILELGRKAFCRITELSAFDRGLGLLFKNEMHLIEEAYLSLGSLKGRKFRSKKKSYPAVMGLAMNLVRTGEEGSSVSAIRSFIEGVEKNTVLRFSETECFHLFARLSLILYLGELAKYEQQFKNVSHKEELIKKGFETGNIPSSYDRKTAGFGKEIERGLEEQARIYIKTLRCYLDPEIIRTPTEVSKEESLLSSDPAGIYSRGTEQTKGYVRFLVATEASITGSSEADIISSALLSANADKGVVEKICSLPHIERKRKSGRIIWLILDNLLPAVLGVLTGMYGNVVSAIFSGLLWRETVSAFLNFISPRFVLPREICALEFENGVPEQFATACVISLLVPDRKTVFEYADKLLKYHLSNVDLGTSVKFGLLMDLKDSDEPVEKADEDIISAVSEIMDGLNERYGRRFFAVTRDRVKSRSEGKYIPWERKRGAITEFSAFLAGKENSCRVLGLEFPELLGIKYILTLDADTAPYPGSIAGLIGAAAHPMNRPDISSCGKVVSGYGIIKPRLGIELESANTSLFSKIFAGQGGTSHYSSSLSDGEWCLFGVSHFTGKGIIDVKAMNLLLENFLPEERILSHDILEGGCLRCGYCHQAEFSDGFPSTVRGYYKRLGRWTRGDIQLLPWVFSKVRNRNGEKVSNTINPLTAFEISKNAFRALYPFSALVAIIAFVVFGKGWRIAAAAAVLSLSVQLVINIVLRLFSNVGIPPRKHSDVYSGWRGGVMLAFSRFVFLPFEAWVTLRSSLTALWRMTVSKKKLLEWVTAAEGDRLSPKGPLKTYCSMISSVIIAAFTILLGMDTASFSLGVIWLLAPLYGAYLSVSIEKQKKISSADKRLLKDHAEKIESYFADLFKTPYILPCDNYQEMPYVGWADRTSPTNIGMCFLAAVASAELGLISRKEAVLRCEKLCFAVEGLEKYRGNLYNWYSCSTAKPLEPRFISSVDSGNLVAALASSAIKISSWDVEGANDLSNRLNKLWRNTDLSVFYSREQKLICIGLDGDKKRLGGFYDMLAGEARLTYYVAAAKGDIPVKSWSALSRSAVKAWGYAGLASWSGSLFEYLMPEIFMPVYDNSLLYEAGEFAIGIQKKYGDSLGLPWGVSECCYPEFDPMMNYQYKAHGNSRLALGNVGTGEYIVSPYSSYLALGRGVKRVCRNLERITEYGAMGRYGLCESLDFTGSRIPEGMDSVSVKTYMTHHLGMSLCSVANVLCDSVFIKSFMDVPEFSAMEQLLKEQVPSYNRFHTAKHSRVIKDRKENVNISFGDMVYKRWGNGDIPCGIVSDGGLTVWGNAKGEIISRKDGIPLYRSDIGFIIAVCIGDKSYFLNGESNRENIKRSFTVKKDCFEYSFEQNGIKIKECIFAVKGLSSEKHVITLYSEEAEEIMLSVYFEPQLCSDEKYNAHPEFERLKLEAKAEDKRNIVLRRRDSSYGDRFMWVSTDRSPENLCLSRSQSIGRGGCDSAGIFFENKTEVTRSDGDCCVELNYSFKTEAKREFSFEISLCLDSEFDTAKNCALDGLQSLRKSSEFLGLCLKEKLDQQGIKECLYLSGVLACWKSSFMGAKSCTGCQKSDLWKLKISGDDPLAVVSSEDFTSEGKFLNEVFRFIRCHKVLSALGFKFDLAILCNDGGNYDRPVFNGIGVALRLAGITDALNSNGGIHVIDKGSAENKSIGALYTFGMFFPRKREINKISYPMEAPIRHINGALPKRIHSMPLANKCFGAVMADIGPILIYSKNSRLLKLIPWQNDPLASFCRGMKLCIEHCGKKYSLFCENDGIPSNVEFSPGRVMWKRVFGETEYIVTAFTDPVLPSLTFNIKARGIDISVLHWEMMPCICEHEKDSAFILCGGEDNFFTAENPADKTATRFYALWSSFPLKRESERWKGEFEFERSEEGCSLTLCLSVSEGDATFGANFAAEKADSANDAFDFDNLCIKTMNDRLDEYINTWSEYQIKVSRLWAKSSAFQNGGAIGFRDQLQDAASLLLTSPEILREQILKCCAHQYEEGDVMHWFHEGAECFRSGVRTRCSDDLLWLPREVSEYVLSTGDRSVLDVSVLYLKSKPLNDGESDRYESVVYSELKESVFEHCVRAVGMFISRGTDDNGLPYILGGDWNDGFSKLGEKGEGVSLWLAFFAAESLTLFSRICEICSRYDLAEKFRDYGNRLVIAAEKSWDGDRFIRAVTDSGVILGSKESPVFGIDSIAQSFSWFVESPGKEFFVKREIALDSALELLWDKDRAVCKLFDRPVTDRSLGYISDYPSGVRENGGQYTHAAIWLAIACFKAGRADDGYGILKDIIDVAYTENYLGENFVIAADVSDRGRCGWSWYTGSAGWFRRAVLEYMLGIRLEMGVLKVSPQLPSVMDGYACNIKIGELFVKYVSDEQAKERIFTGK